MISDVMVDVTCGPHSIPNASGTTITPGLRFVNSELSNPSPGVFTGPLVFGIEWGPHVTSTITSLVIDLLFGDGS